MYYRSGTGVRCGIRAGQTPLVHSPGGSTFLREMTSVWRQIENSTPSIEAYI